MSDTRPRVDRDMARDGELDSLREDNRRLRSKLAEAGGWMDDWASKVEQLGDQAASLSLSCIELRLAIREQARQLLEASTESTELEANPQAGGERGSANAREA